MDYLQQATELARSKREGALGKTPEPGTKAATRVSQDVGFEEADSGAISSSAHEAYKKHALSEAVSGSRSNDHHLPRPSQVRFSKTRRIDPNDDVLESNRVIAGDVHDARVEIYRQLRSQVLSTMRSRGWSTLAITSAHENAGKTLTAINLAIAISQEVNQTVMLVDLDLRKPNVHVTLGIEIERGIVDHLENDSPLEEVLFNPGFPRLVVLPGLPQGRHASELLTSPEMNQFLDSITNRYPDRLIIFDLPPLLRNDDAMAFVPRTDCCLLVVEDGVTTPQQLERSRALLRDAEVLGTVLNKARGGATV